MVIRGTNEKKPPGPMAHCASPHPPTPPPVFVLEGHQAAELNLVSPFALGCLSPFVPPLTGNMKGGSTRSRLWILAGSATWKLRLWASDLISLNLFLQVVVKITLLITGLAYSYC